MTKLSANEIISNTFARATTDEQIMRLTSILDDYSDYVTLLDEENYDSAKAKIQQSLENSHINKEDYDLVMSNIPSQIEV